MRGFTQIAGLALFAIVATVSAAQAQHIHGHGGLYGNYQGGMSYGGQSYGFSQGSNYAPSYYSSGLIPSYQQYSSPGFYHNTSHYDYQPASVYRHGGHLHVQPAHFDYHQSGHSHY